MAGIRSTLAIFAVSLVFYPIPTSSTPSSELISKNYAQIAQYFGFPSPKLPNISFAKISKQCIGAVEKLNRSELALYLDAFGKPPNGLFLGNIGWLGSYSECTKFIAGAHYCLAFIETPFVKDFSTRWGICVPKQCSEEDVTNALQDIYKISGVVKLSPQKIDDAAYKPVFCNKKPEYTTGVIMTLVLCGAILFLCLVGTIVDIAVSFAKSDSLPLNADDGFISIKGVSTATDQTIHDTERMSLLQSSAEANHKECAILSRHQQEPVLPNVVVRFFLCFSLIQNINGIMDTKVPPSAISSIHGIRVISMWWVILGHTYYFVLYFPMIISGNFRMILGVMQRFTFQAVANGTYSVDSFFLLSGLLVSYLSLGRMEKKKGKLALFQYYFHRFCRLTPTYMFVLLFMHKLGNFLSEGPLWRPEITEYRCRKYWWTNLLYINNFYPTSFEDQCMGWGWYLANDMQFYIISPAILFTAYRFRLRGLLVSVGGLMSISFITTAILFAHYHIGQPVTAKQLADDSSLVYEKPYCRIAPYLVGMVLGYILIHSKNWKLPAKVCTYLFNIAGWSVAISLALSTLYGKYKTVRKNPEPFSRTENITYGTFSRFAWSLALAWVIFACHRGLGGLVNKILSAGFWVPLSRLTYCAYLVHPIVILVHYGSFETVQAYSDVHFAFHFVSFVAMSYGAAFIVSLCVECPMMQLEKLIFKSDH